MKIQAWVQGVEDIMKEYWSGSYSPPLTLELQGTSISLSQITALLQLKRQIPDILGASFLAPRHSPLWERHLHFQAFSFIVFYPFIKMPSPFKILTFRIFIKHFIEHVKHTWHCFRCWGDREQERQNSPPSWSLHSSSGRTQNRENINQEDNLVTWWELILDKGGWETHWNGISYTVTMNQIHRITWNIYLQFIFLGLLLGTGPEILIFL